MNKFAVNNTVRLALVLSLAAAAPVWAAEESSGNVAAGNAVSEVNSGKQIEAVSIGAIVHGGSQNVAVGSSVQIINGGNGQATAVGAQVLGGNGNTVVGSAAQTTGGNGFQAIGYGAQAGSGNYNTVLGSQAYAGGWGGQTSSFNTAVGAGAVAIGGGSVALGAGSVAERPDTVSVGNSSYQRQITNVAPGYYDTDAVNMGQLRGLDGQVKRVGATAFAFSALAPLGYDPKEPTQYAAGLGTYNGTGAVAIGVYHYTNANVLLNAAIGMSNDGWEKSARFGITWRTGGPRKKELVPAVAPPPEETIVDRVKKIVSEEPAGQE